MPALNPRQDQAAKHISTPLLVLAGAGSGKTRVITEKIAYLIQKAGIAPHHITAVTFTNKAAREMNARVSNLLKKSNTRGLSISTFHTLGLTIIKRELKTLGYKSGFSIFDAQDSEGLLKELLHKEDIDSDTVSSFQWRISEWKNGLLSPAQAQQQAADELDLRTALIYEKYQRSLKAYNALDFDDLIMLPVALFRQHPTILESWQNRIRYLLVDEYQDTNLCQYELVKQLVGIRQAFTVVGDDDQSIYAWRGARPENLIKLQQDFPRLELVKLEQNYRSTGHILHAANILIDNNPHIFEKKLWSALGDGDPIRIMACKNAEHEAEKVISELLHHKFIHATQLGDYAILYRGNYQAKLFEIALRQNNIPYFLSGGTSFFSRAEIKDTMAYLRLITNPTDDAAFLRIVNTPRREIGSTTLETLGTYATAREVSLLQACDELGLAQHLKPKALEKLQEFSQWIQHLHRKANGEHPTRIAEQLLKDLDYEYWLKQKSSSDDVAERRWNNVGELLKWLDNLHKKDPNENNLENIISHIMLQDMLERQEDDKDNNQVKLMTLHSAKGLEFPHVFLVGVEEELLPHRNSIEEDNIEEERRLAYVGITRARKTLVISYAEKRKRYGEIVRCEPSRFLQELPKEAIEWEAKKPKRSPEEKKQRGNAHLANMRAMLDK